MTSSSRYNHPSSSANANSEQQHYEANALLSFSEVQRNRRLNPFSSSATSTWMDQNGDALDHSLNDTNHGNHGSSYSTGDEMAKKSSSSRKKKRRSPSLQKNSKSVRKSASSSLRKSSKRKSPSTTHHIASSGKKSNKKKLAKRKRKVSTTTEKMHSDVASVSSSQADTIGGGGGGWNSRFHTSAMPLYDRKQDLYLHKKVPIDSFGAYGKLEQGSGVLIQQMQQQSTPLRSSAKRRNTDSSVLKEMQKRNSKKRPSGIPLDSSSLKRRTSLVEMKRPKSQSAARKVKRIPSHNSALDMREVSAAHKSARASTTLGAGGIKRTNASSQRPRTSHMYSNGVRGRIPQIGNLVDFEPSDMNRDEIDNYSPLYNQEQGQNAVGSLRGIQSLRSPAPHTNPLLFRARNDSGSAISPGSENGDINSRGKLSRSRPSSSSSSRITDILHESTDQMYFSDLRARLRKAWAELHVPDSERLDFMVDHFKEATSRNISILEQELHRLSSQRERILSVLRSVDRRESVLRQLRIVCESFQNSATENRTGFATQIQKILKSLKDVTIETVRAIADWKQSNKNKEKPFIWKSQNYLEKISEDQQWFQRSEAAEAMRSMGMDTTLADVDISALLTQESHRKRPISATLTPLKRQPSTNLSLLHDEEIESVDTAEGSSPVALFPSSKRRISLDPINSSTIRNVSKLYRSPLSKMEYQNISALSIQLAWRRYKALKEFSRRLQEKHRKESACLTIQLLYRRWKGCKLYDGQRRNYFATIVQSAWRRFRACRIVQGLRREKASADDSKTVGTTHDVGRKDQPHEPSSESHTTVAEESNSILDTEPQVTRVQSSIRTLSAKMSLDQSRQLLHMTQSSIRQKQSEQIVNERIKLQKDAEAVAAHQLNQEKAALVLQQVVRVFLAKELTRSHIVKANRETYVQLVQRCLLRLHAQRLVEERRDELVREQQKRDALEIQQVAKAVLARAKVEALRKERMQQWYVIYMQALILRFHACRQVAQQRKEARYELNEKAKIILDNMLVVRLARSLLHAETSLDDPSLDMRVRKQLTQERAALCIQCCARVWLARRRSHFALVAQNATHRAAARIQAVWKGYRTRTFTLPQKREEFRRALKLQLEQEKAIGVIYHALMVLQAQREVARREDRRENRDVYAAITIQCAWKCHVARRRVDQLRKQRDEYNNNQLQREAASYIIQRTWRMYQAKIRALIRMHVHMIETRALPVLQRAFRCYLARKRLKELRQFKRYSDQSLEKRKEMALVIQCAYRKYRSRKLVSEAILQKKKMRARQVLQRAALVWRFRLACRKRARQERAAVIIQKYARTYMVHQNLYAAAACKVQSAVRRHMAKKFRRTFQLELIRKKIAARSIQNAYRQRFRERVENPVILVQSIIRRNMTHHHEIVNGFAEEIMGNNAKIESAVCIQRAFRVFKAKAELAALKRKKDQEAALRIQASVRRMLARRRFEALIQRKKIERFEQQRREQVILWLQCVARTSLILERSL